MSSMRSVGRRYFNSYDTGFSRLSRIDEEQLDRISINNCKSDSSSTTPSPDCSSTLSTPLPPFPSPPVLLQIVDSANKTVTTPPLPPPPNEEHYATPPPLTSSKGTRFVDVDAAIYSSVDDYRRPTMTSSATGGVARSAPGDETVKVPSMTSNGGVKDAAAALFIKEKYDSLGRLQIDRTCVPQVNGPGSPSIGGTGTRLLRETPLAAPVNATGDGSHYQIPSSTVCCRSSSCAGAVRTSGSCCGDRSTSGDYQQNTHECLRRQSSTPCQHHQQYHHHHSHQQQHQQHQQLIQHPELVQRNLHNRSAQQRQCAHQPAHRSIANPAKPLLDNDVIEDGAASLSNLGDRVTLPMHAHQDHHSSCCRHKQNGGEQFAGVSSTSPQRTTAQQKQLHPESRSAMTSSSDAATSVAAGSMDVERPPILTELEQTQIEMFYRSHKTLVHACPATVRLAFASADCNVDCELEKAVAAAPGSISRDAATQLSLPTSVFFDERNWSASSISGVPVAVLDSGSGRRHRCLSVVLAERGTGFEMWRTTVKRPVVDYHCGETPTVPSATEAQHHIVRVRGGTPGDGSTSSSARWARLTFEDSTPANDFAKHLLNLAADRVGLDEETAKSDADASSKMADRCRTAPVKKKTGSFRKSDISQPCCFSHVTRIERIDCPAVTPSGTGLRGILRGGFGVAMRGLAAAVSAGTGSDSAAPTLVAEGTAICRR